MSSRAVGLLLTKGRYVPVYWESLRWDGWTEPEVITGDVEEFIRRAAPDYWAKMNPGKRVHPIEWRLLPPGDKDAIVRKLKKAQGRIS